MAVSRYIRYPQLCTTEITLNGLIYVIVVCVSSIVDKLEENIVQTRAQVDCKVSSHSIMPDMSLLFSAIYDFRLEFSHTFDRAVVGWSRGLHAKQFACLSSALKRLKLRRLQDCMSVLDPRRIV